MSNLSHEHTSATDVNKPDNKDPADTASFNTVTLGTSRALSLRLGLGMLLITLFFASLADYFLYQSLVNKDQSLVKVKAETYLRVAHHSGLEKLIEVIEQEGNNADLWLIEVAQNDTVIYQNQTDTDSGDNTLRISDPYWPILDTVRKRWLVEFFDLTVKKAGLVVESNGYHLTLGLSSLPRQAQQVEYRWAILLTLLPLLLLCLWLIHRVHSQALLPIRDLIKATQEIQSGQNLSSRIPVRDQDTELGQLAIQTNDFLANTERLINGMHGSLDNVAHDLRTPLARQRLQIEQLLLSQEVQQQEDLFNTLADIAEDSQRIEQMLSALMDISEAETGLMALYKDRIHLIELFAQVTEVCEFLAEDKSINIEVDCAKSLYLEADINRMRQVLINLLDNAIKFSPDDSRVILKASRSVTRQVVIEVIDQGPGISDQDQVYIFDRLYRADKSRHTKGLGLGLSLVKAIVEAHEGQIEVQNQTRQNDTVQGCCFKLIFKA